MLVLLSQRGQVLTEVQAVLVVAATLAAAAVSVALLAALTLAVAISAVVAFVERQLSTVVAFEQHRLSVTAVRTLPVEVSAEPVVWPHSTPVALECQR